MAVWYDERGKNVLAGRRTGVENPHSAHGAAGVIEDPFLVVVHVARRGGAHAQLVDNVLDDGAGVIAVRLDGTRLEVSEVVELEDVELV